MIPWSLLYLVFQGADTDSMQGSPYRDCGGAGIHFSETGLNAHAQLWFDLLVVQVPEPSTLHLAAVGVLGVLGITGRRSDEL